ncbi:MAG TPA: NAD(P)H-binding protein [Streptosporangiaceae bacterium]|nr:NAD(P)H-binding protein [Streptosporangiaceae bacterium]
MIFVIGGNSKVGRELVRLLTVSGHEVTMLCRTGQTAQAARNAGATPVVGNLDDPASLQDGLRGAKRMFLLSSPDAQDVGWHRNAIDAAAAAGVNQVVRSSLIGADSASSHTFLQHHGAADDYLRGSGVTYTIVRPNNFMQNVPDQMLPSISPDGSLYGSVKQARISFVDARDVAAVAAQILLDGSYQDTTLDVTGPQALSYPDIAARLGERLSRDVRYVDVPIEQTKAVLDGFGVGPWLSTAICDLYLSYQQSGPDGYAAQVTDVVHSVTGRGPRSLDELLAE